MIQKAWRNEKFRYLAVGAYNTFFGYGLFALLWTVWGHTLHYVWILCISHILSVTNAYFGYKIFVFHTSTGGWKAFLKFNTVYIGAFLFNLLALPLLVDGLELHPLLAQMMIVGTTVVTSFLLHKNYSFSN